MANGYTSQDLVKQTLQRAGEVTDGTSQYHDLALIYLNKVYQGILAGESEFAPDIGEGWIWARAQNPINLVIQPVYVQGTVAINQGATTGMFASSGPPAISYQNAYLHVEPNASFYQITQHQANQSVFTIECPFIEGSTTGSSYEVLPLVYDLVPLASASILRLVEPFRVYDFQTPNPYMGDQEGMGKIFGLDLNRFRRDYPLAITTYGTPTRFANLRRGDNTWQIVFERCPGLTAPPIKCDIDYIPIYDDLTDSTESVPLLPKQARTLLADGAAYYLLLDKEDSKAQQFFQKCKAGIETMWRAQNRMVWQSAKERGRLVARQDLVKAKWLYYW
jgi:hypothetical protein